MSFFQKYKYIIIASAFTLSVGALYFIKKSSIQAKKWSSDINFFITSLGVNLKNLAQSVGITLKRNRGLNESGFSEAKYQAAKSNPKVYWAIYDINNQSLIASSKNASKNVYGASVPKVCVASAALSLNNGKVSDDAYKKIIKLLVKSDNDVWTDVQNLAGGGNAVNQWAKKMGYTMQPARSMGNNANAIDMCKFFNDVCRNNFVGAEAIFKITSSCETDTSRGRKYMPSQIYMGGKTGTYNDSNHNCCWIQNGDNFYAISVLTELSSGGSDTIALMFRGLYNEYIEK